MKKKVFIIGLLVIVALLLFFCNEKLNKNTEPESTDPANKESVMVAPAAKDTVIAQKANPKFRIVPGESIGDIHILHNTETLASLGEPTTSDSAMGKSWLTWAGKDGHELNIYTTYKDSEMKEKVVKLVRSSSPDFATDSGAGTGKDAAVIKAAFPDLKEAATYTMKPGNGKVTIWDDAAQGIAFETAASNGKESCIAVIIHEKGKKVTDTYITLHPDMKKS